MSISTLAVTVTALLSLFVFSYARIPLIIPENDVIHRHPSHSSPESDTKATILLPSQKSASELGNIADQFLEPAAIASRPLDTHTYPIESAVNLPESDADSDAATLSRPMAVVSFHPISRQFRLKRPYPVRFPHHRCRHRSKPTGPNDVLGPVLFRGGVRQIPARWVTFHHHRQHHDGRPRFAFKHHRVFEKELSKTVEEKKGREEREKEGFMKRIRKFLITPTF